MAKSAELQLILSAKDQASKIIGGVKDSIAGLAKVGAGLAVGAVGAVGALGAGALKLAKDAAAIPGVAGAFEGLGGSIEKMREGSLGMVTDIDLMRSFNSAAQLVSQDFAEQLPDAMGYLSKVSAATGQDMGFMIDSMVKGVGRLSPMILDNLGIQVSLEEAMARAAEMYGVSTEELTKEQQQAGMMNVVMEKLAANTAAMPEVMGSAAQQTASFETQLANLKNGIGVALLPVLTTFVGMLAGFLREHGPQFAAWAQQAAGWITGTLVPGIQQLVENIRPFVEAIAAFVRDHAEEFKAALIAIGAVLAGAAIVGGIASIAGAIAALANPIGLIIAIVALLAAAWAGNWGGIQEKTAAALEWIKGAIATATAFIQGIWTQYGEQVMAILTLYWNYFAQIFETGKQLITDIIAVFTAALAGDWTAFGETLRTLTDNLWNNIKRIFASAVELLKGTVGKLIEAVIAWFRDTDWGAVGKGVIDGIIRGISNGIGAIRDAARNVAQAALDAAKGFLGIKSPSTEFAEVGAMMVAGIPLGMEKEKASVLEKVADWINSIMSAFTVLKNASAEGWSVDALRVQVDAVEAVLAYAIDRFQHLQNLFGYEKIKLLQNTAKRFMVILEAVMVDLSKAKALTIPDIGAWFATLVDVFGRAMTMLERINAQYGAEMLERAGEAGGYMVDVLKILGVDLAITAPPVNFPVVLAAFLTAIAAGAPLIIDALLDVQSVYGDVLAKTATTADGLGKVMGVLGIGKLIDELTLTKKLEKGEKRMPFIKALTALLSDLSKGADILIPAMLALDAKYGGVLEIVTSVTDKIKAAFGGVADAAKSAGEIAGAKFNIKDFGAGLARFQQAAARAANAFAGPQMAMAGAPAGGGGATFPSTITMRLTLDIPSMGLTSDETDVTIDTKTGIAAAQNLTLHASSKGV